MSRPCLSPSSTFRLNSNDSQNERKSLQQKNTKKRARIAFDAIESMDASDYLSQVIQEAKGMADIFVDDTILDEPSAKVARQRFGGDPCGQDPATTPQSQNINASIDGSAASLSYLLSKRASMTPPPSIRYLPVTKNIKDWAGSVISNFERLREYLERSKAQGIGGKKSNRRPVPTMKDKASWHIFCLGVDEARGNTGAYFADEYGDGTKDLTIKEEGTEGDDKSVEEIPSWRINLPAHGREPSVRLLLQMDQVMVRRVLSHLCYYVNLGWSICVRRAEWIYALLARLEKPIHRDDAAVLFELLKNMTLARSKIDFSNAINDGRNLAKLNVLIVLVGVYFEQGGSLNKLMTCE